MQKFKFIGEDKFINGLKEAEKYLDVSFCDEGISVLSEKCENLCAGYEASDGIVKIKYNTEHEFFYLFMRYLVEKDANSHIDVPSVGRLGFMVDCSRNAVWKISSVKKCIVYLAFMGYGYLELYTEDTYEIPNEKHFGYMRGRYSVEEIKDIDSFAKLFGIELVPCIQTLAHLNGIFRWNEYKAINDADDILLLREDRTYELIENMFRSIAMTFSSRRINIGMDEAMFLGAGRFSDKHGYVPRFELMVEHLNKVVEIADRYGFTVSLWNDMFFRVGNGNEYRVENAVFSDDILKNIPQNAELIYWDYVSEDQTVYENMLKNSLMLTKNTGFAGGLFSWHSFTCDNDLAMRKIVPAVNACKKYGIQDILVTTWGDDGAEASRFSCLPTMCAFADYVYNGNFDLTDKILKRLFNYGFREFCDISLVNRYIELENITSNNVFYGNTAKYMLYNDLFLGLFDANVPENAGEYGIKNYERLNELAERNSPVSYLFKTMSSLSRILVFKADLGKRIKIHYDDKDIIGLKKDLKTIGRVKTLLKQFIKNYQEQWLKENKPFGLEVNQIRLGGLSARIDYVGRILKEFIKGKVKVIDEMEEPRLAGNYADEGYKFNLIVENWNEIVTCGKI